jgi:hypothetical protein
MIQQANLVTGTTFGRPTSGSANQSIRVSIPPEVAAEMAVATIVRIQYCDNIVEIAPDSLADIQSAL